MGPSATGWSNWVGRIHIMYSGPFRDHYGTPGAPKRARFGPKCPFWRPRRSSEGPRGPDLVPTAANWSAWVRLIVTTHLGLMLGLIVAAKGLNLAEKGHFGPKGALLEPPGARKRPDTRPKCVVAMSPTQVDQTAAVGTKSEPPGPTEDLRGSKKGLLGPK